MTALTVIGWYAAIGYLVAANHMMRLKLLGLLWHVLYFGPGDNTPQFVKLLIGATSIMLVWPLLLTRRD